MVPRLTSKKSSELGHSKRSLSENSETLRQLYLQNKELAIRNKVLSLLAKLYNITLAISDRDAMSQQLVDEIRASLYFECVSLFVFEQKNKLTPIAFSVPQDLKILTKKLRMVEVPLQDQVALVEALHDNREKGCRSLASVWGVDALRKFFTVAEKKLKIHSSLIFPLTADKPIGLLTISSNHPFKDSSQFERESLGNIVKVITIALNKVLVHEQLQKHVEKIKELYEIKSSFLTIASHQLRTPVSIIRGMLSLMAEKDTSTEEKLQMIPQTFQAANNLEHIIHDILTATEIDSSKLRADIEPTDMEPILDGVLKTLQLKTRGKGIRLLYKKPITPLKPVLVEPIKIQEAVFNIIDNAINYTEKGNVVVSWQKIQRKGKKYQALVVKDMGIGMATADQKRLGEKFYRSKHALSVHPNGTGLGLFITKGVLDASYGILEFESEGVGKGSVFRLLFLIAGEEVAK